MGWVYYTMGREDGSTTKGDGGGRSNVCIECIGQSLHFVRLIRTRVSACDGQNTATVRSNLHSTIRPTPLRPLLRLTLGLGGGGWVERGIYILMGLTLRLGREMGGAKGLYFNGIILDGRDWGKWVV